ncbi:MAG TPA: hypothetical protein VJZ49_02200 [Syntrophales bacterium]|nr:hypothetical protein [Syntrophales bacterium]
MTISVNKVDSAISTYNTQNKVKVRQFSNQEETKNVKHQTDVSLSQGTDKPEANKKTFYSIIDIILKHKGI